ncbi:MAG: AAA family ATPase, partial [Acidobacteriota bacterium]
MSLFDDDDDPPASPASAAPSPLAERMRPRTLDEFVGQEALIGAGRPLRRAIEQDRLQSIILWGPPGTGKTTLARLIANVTRAHFISFSAVMSGIKEIRTVMIEAEEARRRLGRRTILFVDEIHRFNKSQQDAFLPRVEAGDIVLIGAT